MYVVLASVGGEQLTARLVGEPSLGSTSRSGRSAPRSESRWAIDHTIRTRWLSELTDDTIGWEPAAASESTHHESWADTLCDALDSAALPGGYPSLLGPDHHDRLALAHGPNAERLRELKRRYDPEDVFASAICALGAAL